ncbi:MAG: hypothetical protein JRG76_16580 [Deltaproteobacteria bacterium]|nr:hypothetical protein [Deltaproteobacteria bacterium]
MSTTGAVTEISAPVSFLAGDTESSTEIVILDEGTTLLPIEIFVNAIGVGLHSGSSGAPVAIASGTLVHTYLVHFDPAGGVVTLSGDVFFDPGETILGIQTHTPWLDGSDAVVGEATATYPTGLLEFRAFETLPGTDTVFIAPGLGSASFTLFAELGIDEARIVTTSVPAPSSLALLLLGLAAFGVGTTPLARTRSGRGLT